MAKRARQRQTTIRGTSDKIPKEVEDLAEQYANVLKDRMAKQERENTLRADLMEALKKCKAKEVFIPDGRKIIIDKSITEKIKVVTPKDD